MSLLLKEFKNWKGVISTMKIVACPKGGRIPEGYCQQSCLNYSGERDKEKSGSLSRIKNLFKGNVRSWLQIYKEEIGREKSP